MGDVLASLFPFLLVALGLLVFGGIGRKREADHIRELDRREAATSDTIVTDLKTLPIGMSAGAATLVMGEVVIANDYFKTWVSQIRNIFGGELKSYQTLMNRARREARLRMVESARQRGATTIINVRFETSQIGSSSNKNAMPTTEVLCFGTALLPTAGPHATFAP